MCCRCRFRTNLFIVGRNGDIWIQAKVTAVVPEQGISLQALRLSLVKNYEGNYSSRIGRTAGILIKINYDIVETTNKKRTVELVLLAKTKAFDSVDHNRILLKLYYYVVSGKDQPYWRTCQMKKSQDKASSRASFWVQYCTTFLLLIWVLIQVLGTVRCISFVLMMCRLNTVMALKPRNKILPLLRRKKFAFIS